MVHAAMSDLQDFRRRISPYFHYKSHMQIQLTKMWFSFFFVFFHLINVSVASLTPTVATSDDAIASFIKDKYRHLKASCFRESRQDFCRVIYTIPAKSCEKNKQTLQCQYTFDRINTGQIHLVVPAGVSFNDQPLEPRFQVIKFENLLNFKKIINYFCNCCFFRTGICQFTLSMTQ